METSKNVKIKFCSTIKGSTKMYIFNLNGIEVAINKALFDHNSVKVSKLKYLFDKKMEAAYNTFSLNIKKGKKLENYRRSKYFKDYLNIAKEKNPEFLLT